MGKYIDVHLSKNFFVFLLSCLAVKSNNMLTLLSEELFQQLHWLLPKGHDYLKDYKYSSRENTVLTGNGALNHFYCIYYPEIELQYKTLGETLWENKFETNLLVFRIYWNIEHLLIFQLKFVQSLRLWIYKVVKTMN